MPFAIHFRSNSKIFLNQEDGDKLSAQYDSHITEPKRRFNVKSKDSKMSKTNSTHKSSNWRSSKMFAYTSDDKWDKIL